MILYEFYRFQALSNSMNGDSRLFGLNNIFIQQHFGRRFIEIRQKLSEISSTNKKQFQKFDQFKEDKEDVVI